MSVSTTSAASTLSPDLNVRSTVRPEWMEARLLDGVAHQLCRANPEIGAQRRAA